jgi:precorrin-2 dehydrogenase / sirohydrochlorin ferrochelatase
VIEANLYIACIMLGGRSCLVVGGGAVALEKVEGLLVCGADVTVVAPKAVEEIQELSATERIAWKARPYADGDIEGCRLVIAATSDTELNRRVHHDAEERGVFVNVADVPELCTFILPAIVRNDPIAIAISTAGASPALAQRMKREAAAQFGPEYSQLAVLLDGVRDWARSTLPTYGDRKEFFDGIVNGDPDPIALLRAGDMIEVERLIADAQRRAEVKARRGP